MLFQTIKEFDLAVLLLDDHIDTLFAHRLESDFDGARISARNAGWAGLLDFVELDSANTPQQSFRLATI